MAKYTKFPAAAPPQAPERASTSRLLLRGYIILVFASVFGHPAVILAFGETGGVVATAILTATSVAIWVPEIVKQRPTAFAWRRLPWAALAYVFLMLVSAIWARASDGSLRTGALLVVLTIGGLFIAHSLTWPEIVNALSGGLKWVIGLSVAFELWAAYVLRHPVYSDVVDGADGGPQLWTSGDIFAGGPIHGIVGDPYLLAPICLLAIIVFCALFVARVRWRMTLLLWIAISAFGLYRTGSTTTWVAAAVCAVLLAVALFLRRVDVDRYRALIYLAAFAIAIPVVGASMWSAATGRPGWISINLTPNHNMWVDARIELGWVGIILIFGVYAALFWRAWFFAVDRPRWDLKKDRHYSPLAVVPMLITTMLIVQGVVDAAPLMMWGWMLAVLLSFKLKAVPLLSPDLSERERMIERGAPVRKAR
jgi:exopolysaccharide production protein ExoQ